MKIHSSTFSSELREVRKLGRKLLTLVPIGLLVSFTNVVVDPARLYRSHTQESEIADYLSMGLNVENAGFKAYLDERLIHQHRVARMTQAPDIVVLGSSRSRQIRQDFFSGLTLYNSSIRLATLNDMMALFYSFLRQGLIPKKVLLEVEPSMFNLKSGMGAGYTLRREIRAVNRLIHLRPAHALAQIQEILHEEFDKNRIDQQRVELADRLFQLVSPTYFQASLSNLVNYGNGVDQQIRAISGIESSSDLLLFDGSMTYPQYFLDRTSEDVDHIASKVASSRYRPGLSSFSQIDPILQDNFALFLNLMKLLNVEVTLVMMPYHPIVFKEIKKIDGFNAILSCMRFVQMMAKARGLRVIGSYDPGVIQAVSADFYDESHLRLEAVKRMRWRDSK